MKVRLYATLRPVAGGKSVELREDHVTIGEALDELVERFSGLRPLLFDDEGSMQRFVSVMVSGRDIRHLAGLETPLTAESEVDIFPPVAGG